MLFIISQVCYPNITVNTLLLCISFFFMSRPPRFTRGLLEGPTPMLGNRVCLCVCVFVFVYVCVCVTSRLSGDHFLAVECLCDLWPPACCQWRQAGGHLRGNLATFWSPDKLLVPTAMLPVCFDRSINSALAFVLRLLRGWGNTCSLQQMDSRFHERNSLTSSGLWELLAGVWD